MANSLLREKITVKLKKKGSKRGWLDRRNNQTRRQEKLGTSQDKSKVSHNNDWCAKFGSNTTPPKETAEYSQKYSSSWRRVQPNVS